MTDQGQTAESSRLVYEWGGWRWYYRALDVVVYLVVVFSFVGFYAPIRDLLREPSGGNIAMAILICLIPLACLLWGYVTWWRSGTRPTRIELLPDGVTLQARMLNFRTRTIAVADITDVEYSAFEQYASRDYYANHEYYAPHLTVEVRDDKPLKIDAQGRIRNVDAFKTVFRFDPENPEATRRKKRPKKEKGRNVPS